jgi:hypothetical protein
VNVANVTAPTTTTPNPGTDDRRPSLEAGVTSIALVLLSLLLAGLVDLGDGFKPIVPTVDALAGLAVGAFIVDRLLTFVPPLGAAKTPEQRATDLTLLRFGYGSVLGMCFVVLTDLRAVQVLSGENGTTISAGVDRAIAVLAIAGGVAGLARLLSGINPQPKTDATKDADEDVDKDAETIPPPGAAVRIFGLVALGLAALLALLVGDDKTGVQLLGQETDADGVVTVVVRFGLVFLAAAIVEQLGEFAGRFVVLSKNKKPIILGGLAVVLGVVAARVFDLFVLHNIGFFGAEPGTPLNDTLAESSKLERWGDTFLTGLLIAAGTKPLHDLSSRLRKANE